MQEKWKTIKGFKDYAISNCGKVKRLTPARGTKVGHILKPWKISDGYLIIELRKNGESYSKLIARLVTENFIGPCPEGQECNHKDGVKTNNNINNLEWVTHSQNIIHSIKTGLRPMGENRTQAKLTNYKVKEIKHLLKNTNLSFEKIAKLFGVSDSTINDIKQGVTWRHIGY